MVSQRDKQGLSAVSPELKEIYDQAMSHEPWPDRVYKCEPCKDKGLLDNGARCKCLITQIKMEKFHALMKECRIPGAKRFTFDRYKPKNESQAAAKRAVMAFERGPKGFYLVGDTGVGKTHLMTALAQRVVDVQHRPAIVFSSAVLFDNLLSGTMEAREEKFRQVMSIPFLVIDDIGEERRTEAVDKAMWSLINERYNAFTRRVTCFTSNLMQSQLKEACGYSATMIDRIRGLADEIIVTGPSGR
jgi:DNA replication protein DnaC